MNLPYLQPSWRTVLPWAVMAAALTAAGAGPGCAQGVPSADLASLSPQTVAVNETLRLPLIIHNPAGEHITVEFEGPSLPVLQRTTALLFNESGAEFRWTPLVSHLGTHEFVFIVKNAAGAEQDREPVVITVEPTDAATPIFLRPGAGGTFDLARDPCVSFDIEVRDDDSLEVTIGARADLPEGAELMQDGPKHGVFRWCPGPDQIAATERWTIPLSADDHEHRPTEHDFVVVLRSPPKENCPGEAPTLALVEPAEAARIEGGSGYPVVLTVSDDFGLRDAPLLYYTTAAPDDPDKPDVTMFDQMAFTLETDRWVARVPPLDLEAGAEQTIYLVASATDNDDATGTLCDHRTDTPLRTFLAVGTTTGGDLARCSPCTASAACASGICAAAAGGGRCLETCGAMGRCDPGSCSGQATVEGSTTPACGDVAAACDPVRTCMDDSREPNNTIAQATMAPANLSDGQICAANDDFFRIDATNGTEVRVTVSGFTHATGDLDLQLLDAASTILGSSAGTEDREQASYCLSRDGTVYARVFGYMGSENRYAMQVEKLTGTCCVDDGGEDDDSRSGARAITPAAPFDGTICPGDDDYVSFSVSEPSEVEVTIVFDHAVGDLDLELYGPTGAVVGRSTGSEDIETITETVTATGTYVARVYGYRDAEGPYLGELRVVATVGCTATSGCPTGQVCDAGSCRSDVCSGTGTCPTGHGCPTPAGPGATSSHCGLRCDVNRECRSDEGCKRFVTGNFCGVRGAGQNGDACASFTECGGQRACLPYPGGYCARAGCASNADCESDTRCVMIGGTGICAKQCAAGPDLCRQTEGYGCRLDTDVHGAMQFVCLPP